MILEESFPSVLVEARRARGLTPDALARLCDLPVATVVAVESGEAPTIEVRAAIGRVLSLAGEAIAVPSPPRPVSDRHALMLHLLRAHNHDRSRLEAHADVAAWWAAQEDEPRPPAPRPVSVGRKGWRAPRRGERPAMTVAAYLAVIGVSSLVGAWWIVPWGAVFATSLLAFSFLAHDRLLARQRASRGVDEDLDRIEDAVRAARDETREKARKGMVSLLTERGYLLGRRGVEVVDICGDPGVPSPPRKEIRADQVYGIRVELVGPRHVTVHLKTVWGDLDMPWLPRTKALLEALRSLTRDDVPWTPTFDIPPS